MLCVYVARGSIAAGSVGGILHSRLSFMVMGIVVDSVIGGQIFHQLYVSSFQ